MMPHRNAAIIGFATQLARYRGTKRAKLSSRDVSVSSRTGCVRMMAASDQTSPHAMRNKELDSKPLLAQSSAPSFPGDMVPIMPPCRLLPIDIEYANEMGACEAHRTSKTLAATASTKDKNMHPE